MSVAALLWRNAPIKLQRSQLSVPMIVYLSNFIFAAALSLGSGFVLPVSLGLVFGVVPVVILWSRVTNALTNVAVTPTNSEVSVANIKVAVK
jgi:putative membrane protein